MITKLSVELKIDSMKKKDLIVTGIYNSLHTKNYVLIIPFILINNNTTIPSGTQKDIRTSSPRK